MDPCDENAFSSRVPGLHNAIRPAGKGHNQENHNPIKPPRTRRPLGEISGNGNFNQSIIPSDRHNDFKTSVRAGNENVPPKQLPLQQRQSVGLQARPVPLGEAGAPAKRPRVLRDPRFNEFGRQIQAPLAARLPEPNFVIYKDESSTAEESIAESAADLERHQSSQQGGSVPPPMGVAAQVAASSTGSDFSFGRETTASSLYAPSVSEFRQNVSISSVSSDDENENDLTYDTESSDLKSAKGSRGVADDSADDVEKSFDGELMLYDRNREAVPRCVLEVNDYEQDILLHARQSELRYLPKWNYMTKQSDITFAMRSILVDWLVEVGEEYQMGTETVYLAVNYIDRFLSFMSVQRAKLQLVGTSSIFIASKYEEIYPPDLGQFVYITDDTYTRKQILKMEQLILGVLGFSVTVPTAYYFVNHFSKLAGSSDKTRCLSQFLAELTLVNGETYLPYLPSVIAAAAVALARHTLGFAAWDANMIRKTGYCVEDFKHCLVNLHETFKNAKKSQQQAVVDKYKNAKHHAVSFTEPTSIF